MVTEEQVRALRQLKNEGRTLKLSALKTGMDVKTARKYLEAGQDPSRMRPRTMVPLFKELVKGILIFPV